MSTHKEKQLAMWNAVGHEMLALLPGVVVLEVENALSEKIGWAPRFVWANWVARKCAPQTSNRRQVILPVAHHVAHSNMGVPIWDQVFFGDILATKTQSKRQHVLLRKT